MGPFRPSTRKLEPYESGMTPIGPAMRRLPVKFYLVAGLFILFDIEIVFFLPFSVVARQLGVFALAEIGTFVVILLVGYVYPSRDRKSTPLNSRHQIISYAAFCLTKKKIELSR